MTCREDERTRSRESGVSWLPPPTPPAPAAPPPLPTHRQAHTRSLARTHRHARTHAPHTHAPLSPARSHPSRPAPSSRVQRGGAAAGRPSRAHFAALTAGGGRGGGNGGGGGILAPGRGRSPVARGTPRRRRRSPMSRERSIPCQPLAASGSRWTCGPQQPFRDSGCDAPAPAQISGQLSRNSL